MDEVGDIPRPLEPKLLRVLQEQEFERLGSGQTHRVDVRVVAATHRDLGQMVKRNEFRSDLYYRLNVFPVLLPPLRARQEDIPRLVTHFIGFYSRRMGKHIEYVAEDTMAALISYPWPGNVRELQNLIERAVILSCDGVLPNPLPLNHQETVAVISNPTALKEVDRALILQAVEAAGWMIGGSDGAAAKLGLKRTTLISKMKKLGICRPTGGTTWMTTPIGEDQQLWPITVPNERCRESAHFQRRTGRSNRKRKGVPSARVLLRSFRANVRLTGWR